VPWITLAAALTVIGLYVKRIVLVVPPLYHSFYANTEKLYRSEEPVYHASVVEVLVTLGALAAIPLLLMAFFRVFPVFAINEMADVAAEEAAHDARAVEAVRAHTAEQ
jgi:Ni/Fe-hydrogenase subunit HybB-like protein